MVPLLEILTVVVLFFCMCYTVEVIFRSMIEKDPLKAVVGTIGAAIFIILIIAWGIRWETYI